MACTDLLSNAKDEFPAGVPDPRSLDNEFGALAFYNAAVCSFTQCMGLPTGTGGQNTFETVVFMSGLFSDELISNRLGDPVAYSDNNERNIDSRQNTMLETVSNTNTYGLLHRMRQLTRQARGALQEYGGVQSTALRGHMFALEGYAELFLADLYCSGVPLSTVDYKKDFTYQAGSTTQEVYAHAVSLFDSAIAISSDSSRILNLARVGKARALANLGKYSNAAQVAIDVPAGFTYRFSSNGAGNTEGDIHRFALAHLTVSDREGNNGISYISSGDPRTRVVQYGTNEFTGATLWFPEKYGVPDATYIMVIADAVEARLIQAEAALHDNRIETWLTILNVLRTSGIDAITPDASDQTSMDTTWTAGSGGIAELAPLSDPGADLVGVEAKNARIDLHFAERAKWLFLTGHRQGDLRRLVRSVALGGYGRSSEKTYPTGVYYPIGQFQRYGLAVNLTIPNSERINPKFTGCLDRRA